MIVDALEKPLHIAGLNAHPTSLEKMRAAVEALGYQFDGFEQSQLLLKAVQRQPFDLLLLAWPPSDYGGVELIRKLRSELDSAVPTMIVARRATKKEQVEALHAGADVFLSGSEPREFSARLEALVRRSFPHRSALPVAFGPYRFLPELRALQFRGEVIELQFREYDLARFMFQNLGCLLSRKRICDAVCVGLEPDSRALDTRMSRIRTRLSICPENGFVLSASYGQGYRLDAVSAVTMPAWSD